MSDDPHVEALLVELRQYIEVRGAPLHPDMVVVLEGGVDPTARTSRNTHGEVISAELRSVESALAYYTIESLFIALTPLGMLATIFFCLQALSGEHGSIVPTPEEERLFDAWEELAPFRTRSIPAGDGVAEDSTAGEECARALWHVSRAHAAVTQQRNNERKEQP